MNLKKNAIIFSLIAGLFLSFFHGHAISDHQPHDQCDICQHQGTVLSSASKTHNIEPLFQEEQVFISKHLTTHKNAKTHKSPRAPPTLLA